MGAPGRQDRCRLTEEGGESDDDTNWPVFIEADRRTPDRRDVCRACSRRSTAQTPATTTVQSLQDRAATGARNDVLQLYREALKNDTAYASARSQQLATLERVPQARSALLPNVGLTGRVDQNYYSATIPDVNSNYQVYGGGVNLSVPVYRPQNWEALEQARLTVIQSEAQLAQAQQDLALRVATAYFNVLGARDQLIALEAAKRATLEQLQQARREFEVGTKITALAGAHPAPAAALLITAQYLAAGAGALLVLGIADDGGRSAALAAAAVIAAFGAVALARPAAPRVQPPRERPGVRLDRAIARSGSPPETPSGSAGDDGERPLAPRRVAMALRREHVVERLFEPRKHGVVRQQRQRVVKPGLALDEPVAVVRRATLELRAGRLHLGDMAAQQPQIPVRRLRGSRAAPPPAPRRRAPRSRAEGLRVGSALDACAQHVGVARVPVLALAHFRPAPAARPPGRAPPAPGAPPAPRPCCSRTAHAAPRRSGATSPRRTSRRRWRRRARPSPRGSGASLVSHRISGPVHRQRGRSATAQARGARTHPRRSPRVRGEMIDVVVCDGHPLFLDGLVRVIRQDRDLRLVAETGDGLKALAAIRAHRPQVASRHRGARRPQPSSGCSAL